MIHLTECPYALDPAYDAQDSIISTRIANGVDVGAEQNGRPTAGARSASEDIPGGIDADYEPEFPHHLHGYSAPLVIL
jgi:hypothetical protein